uniref:Transforming growth factor-beta-induced protein ig-h3 n=1 Tax=Hadrurus spadix TaxID=141984 RepID=A0A1W7R9F7_9SCOR
MKCVVYCVVWLFIIYPKQTDSVLSRSNRVWDRSNSDNGGRSQAREPEYHSLMTEVFGLEDKKGTDYRFGDNSEIEREDIEFDPKVVIVDKIGSPSPSVPEKGLWPEKRLLDELFGRMPGFGIEERTKPWWKGQHICVERKEITEGAPTNKSFIFSFVHSSCEERESTYICTKSVRNNEQNKSYVEKRQCCYGYKLIGNKCEQIELQDLIPTMKSLGATRFVKMLKSVNLDEKLNTNNVTVFCPTDDAVIDFEEEEENNKIPSGRVYRDVSLVNVASGHLVDGYLRSGDLANNQLLSSENEETKIRINIYSGFSGRILTANCARLIKADNYATNGVVHLVETMLPMPSKTVADIISSNPQLSILKGLLSQANLVQTLRDANGNFTLFAPTDAAFKNGKIDELLLKKLQDGKACVSSVVKHHMVPYVVCTSAISVAAQVRNLIDEKLIVKRSEDDKLFVNNAQVVSHDIVGTNGVVHIIDDVLMPEEAQTVTQALQSAEMDNIISFIEAAGMKEELDNMKNFTFFLPRPSAIKELLESEFQKETKNARNTIKFHITPTKVKSCEFHNNQILPTKIENATLRVNKYGIFPDIVTIQCAPIISDNNDVCEGTIHYIDRVLVPTKYTILQTLQDMEDVSKFFNLLNDSGLTQMLNEEGPFTVLAPTNEAFGKMHNKHILEDKEKLEDLLKMHILPEMLCCAAVGHGSSLFFRQYVTTLEGRNFSVRRAHHGIRFLNARTLECDQVATNGVIHTLNKVIEPKRQRPLFVSLSDFFDV